ncbi:aminotransferase class V-fold PLP-dependent enzyme [Pontimicrobium sp. MEBiC01747]
MTVKNNAFLAHEEIHFNKINELKNNKSLRELLSNFLGLSSNISFRNNTTTTFIDVIQVLKEDNDYSLIYSDLEHPCIQNAIECFFPKNRIIFLKLYDLLLNGQIREIEKRISENLSKKSIYLISHVLWNTGIKINVESIATTIKQHNSENILIVDGAQAVGNIERLFNTNFSESNIDLYIGCTHKWLETKNLLGFVAVGDYMIKSKYEIVKKVFMKDIFSLYAGKLDFSNLELGMSTYDINLLSQVTKDLNHNIQSFRYPDRFFIRYLSLTVFSIPYFENEAVGTRFFSYYGSRKELEKALDEFKLDYRFIIEDKNLPNNYCWMRLGK